MALREGLRCWRSVPTCPCPPGAEEMGLRAEDPDPSWGCRGKTERDVRAGPRETETKVWTPVDGHCHLFAGAEPPSGASCGGRDLCLHVLFGGHWALGTGPVFSILTHLSRHMGPAAAVVTSAAGGGVLGFKSSTSHETLFLPEQEKISAKHRLIGVS